MKKTSNYSNFNDYFTDIFVRSTAENVDNNNLSADTENNGNEDEPNAWE